MTTLTFRVEVRNDAGEVVEFAEFTGEQTAAWLKALEWATERSVATGFAAGIDTVDCEVDTRRAAGF